MGPCHRLPGQDADPKDEEPARKRVRFTLTGPDGSSGSGPGQCGSPVQVHRTGMRSARTTKSRDPRTVDAVRQQASSDPVLLRIVIHIRMVIRIVYLC
jgi:hypothetical protein